LQWKATHKMGSSFNLKDKVGVNLPWMTCSQPQF
jgi:hypothetical protein